MELVVFGFGIDPKIRQVRTDYYNADGRTERPKQIDRIRNSDAIRINRFVETDRDLNDAIVSGNARVGIKIPVDYSDRLLNDTDAQVQVLIDGSDSTVAGQARQRFTATAKSRLPEATAVWATSPPCRASIS